MYTYDRDKCDKYDVDMVFCVEATSNMKPFATQLNELMKFCIIRNTDVMEEYGRELHQLRVKFVVFRDFACCPEPIVESRFFVLPEEDEALNEFISGIEYKGGTGFCSALEAISLALESDWVNSERRNRHMIWMFSNGRVRPLGSNQWRCPQYPKGMPADLRELTNRWHNGPLDGKYQPKVDRFIAYVPEVEPWTDLQVWDRYWPAFSDCAGTNFEVDDLDTPFELLWGF